MKFMLKDGMSNEEILNVLQDKLTLNPRIREISMNHSKGVEVDTDWLTFTVTLSGGGNQVVVKNSWNRKKRPILIGLGLTGLILIVPLLVLIGISLGQGRVRTEINHLIHHSLNA